MATFKDPIKNIISFYSTQIEELPANIAEII